ncbi:hypothetical protein [Henriciella litoralis]|uniref:hypothetical protein n=1 Tax=Henriciella litoralis TaxID=568102 RepID=UPI00111C0588|nr:hypothetical protein [Henriciella litoralis]
MRTQILSVGLVVAISTLPVMADEARSPAEGNADYAPQTASCDSMQLKVYFEPGTSVLTPFARDAIREAGDLLAGCAVVQMNTNAVAGEMDKRTNTLSLAEARRAVVLNELRANGIEPVSSEVRLGVAIKPSDAVMARKVDIELQTEPAIIG